MRLFPGFYGALLILAVGVPGEALASCCYTAAPVHVYVPPPTHVVIVPHTTYVPQVHAHAPNNTSRSIRGISSTPPAGQAKPTPTHRIVQPVVVSDQTTASARCKQQQAGDGCKKKDDKQTSWATVRQWLQLDKH